MIPYNAITDDPDSLPPLDEVVWLIEEGLPHAYLGLRVSYTEDDDIRWVWSYGYSQTLNLNTGIVLSIEDDNDDLNPIGWLPAVGKPKSDHGHIPSQTNQQPY